MIYTATEFSRSFTLAGKKVSSRTIQRRCEKGLLPSGYKARRVGSGKKGVWVIEVSEKN